MENYPKPFAADAFDEETLANRDFVPRYNSTNTFTLTTGNATRVDFTAGTEYLWSELVRRRYSRCIGYLSAEEAHELKTFLEKECKDVGIVIDASFGTIENLPPVIHTLEYVRTWLDRPNTSEREYNNNTLIQYKSFYCLFLSTVIACSLLFVDTIRQSIKCRDEAVDEKRLHRASPHFNFGFRGGAHSR